MLHGKTTFDAISLPQHIYLKIVNSITTPIAGFEHKRNPDGSFYSRQQQIEASQQQVVLLVKDYYIKGADEHKLMKIISYFTEH